MSAVSSGDLPASDRVREHLISEYAGVFGAGQVERHMAGYVSVDAARPLVSLLKERDPGAHRVLDAGCGYGAFVLAAREAGLDAVGVELARFEVAYARERLAAIGDGDPTEVFIQADATKLPFPAESFDVVTMWNVVEHVPDHGRLLAEAERVLRPGGLLLGIAPNYAAFRREAHYLVPWLPLMPRRVASRYLRWMGRDPRFFESSIFYCTNLGVRRRLSRLGLRLEDPRERRFSDPGQINNRAIRRAVRLLRRAGLGWVPALALRVAGANPLRPAIAINARKPGGAERVLR